MTFPAWFDLNRDPVIRDKPSAYSVYAHLIETYPRIFFEPTDAKAWLIAEVTGLARDSVNESLDLLINRGYLILHGRGLNNVRRVTMAITRGPVAA